MSGEEHERSHEDYDRAPCGLLSTAASGAIVCANQTFCGWLGFLPDELVGCRRVQDLLTIGCKIFHQTHWLPLLQIQGSVAEVQLEFVHREGQVLPALVNAIQRRSADGSLRHDLAVFVAADRRKYERELLAARKRAEELLESERRTQAALQDVLRAQEQEARQRAVLAEQLVGIVSHDLRTPINAILLGAHLLGAKDATPAQARIVNRVSSAASRANRLIGDLLDFTQARLGGGLRVEAREIDLHELVHEGVEELKLAWPGRMIEHHREGRGTSVADADRVSQLVSNLVTNALTYGAPLEPVTVRTLIEPELLTVSVHNAGPPIPPLLLDQVFEPLRRGDQQVKLGSRSVGLGLYIVRQIARSHGGEVSVHSNASAGTTFTVTLPQPGQVR